VEYGRLGGARAEAIRETADLELAGVVRRAGSAPRFPAPLEHVAVATHLRDLGRVDAALLCVPPAVATDAARGILQLRMPLVECAMLDSPAREAHYKAIGDAAHNHRIAAIVGAGWDPGMLPLLCQAFDLLIPSGGTVITARPGVSLHHTEAARNTPGIRGALATEYRGADGRLTRYVYAELANGADAAAVRAALPADPLFAGRGLTRVKTSRRRCSRSSRAPGIGRLAALLILVNSAARNGSYCRAICAPETGDCRRLGHWTRGVRDALERGATMTGHVPEVGAPDPELKTSPIIDEDEYEEPSPDLELEAGVCYFNDVSYPIGQFVRSGSELLRCEGRGVWVREGEMRPD
jgi:diaminopimelate dehydrogenase